MYDASSVANADSSYNANAYSSTEDSPDATYGPSSDSTDASYDASTCAGSRASTSIQGQLRRQLRLPRRQLRLRLWQHRHRLRRQYLRQLQSLRQRRLQLRRQLRLPRRQL